MNKALLILIPLCTMVMTTVAQIFDGAPTLKDDNLKGPVHIVQTMATFDAGPENGYAFSQVVTDVYDTAGRLTCHINSSSDGLDDILTYEYDQWGRLAKVSSLTREVYTDTYHYNAAGQLESIEQRWTEDFEMFNHTLHVVKRDNAGRALLVESSGDREGTFDNFSIERHGDGEIVTETLIMHGDTINVRHTYYNSHGTIDSVVDRRDKTIYKYNANGDIIECRSSGTPDYPKGRVTIYSYGEESRRDIYGNWTIRDIVYPDGSKDFERRTIIYYEEIRDR